MEKIFRLKENGSSLRTEVIAGLKLCTGRAKDISALTCILSVLFIIKFFVAL